MRNDIRASVIFPRSTTNQNVPRDVLLIWEDHYSEMKTTGYIDRNGHMWQCGNWSNDKPQAITMNIMCIKTELGSHWIERAWDSWIAGELK